MANRVKGGNVKPKGKEQHHHNEILEDPEAIRERFSQTESFVKNNSKPIIIFGVIVALAVAGIFGYKYYQNSQNQIAQVEMFQAVYYLEADSLDKALNGDGNNYGFLEIIDNYGITDAANISHYYAGIIYLKKGEFQNAIDHLNKFGSSDELVQARAYALIGDANMELGHYQDAVSYYEKAADYKSNQYFSPGYLVKAAIAYKESNNQEGALKMYKRIVDEFPNSSEFQEAQKEMERLDGITNQ